MSAVRLRSAERSPMESRLLHRSVSWASFGAPIDFIVVEHEHQLAVCAVLDRLLRNPRHGAHPAVVETVREYLLHDLPLHIADEEEDLFPLLRRRCPVGDDVEGIFAILHREHEIDQRLNQVVSDDLEIIISGRAFADPARFLMNLFAFVETQRRHLAWENTVVLPRARRHLSVEDCAELGRRMAARRGF